MGLFGKFGKKGRDIDIPPPPPPIIASEPIPKPTLRDSSRFMPPPAPGQIPTPHEEPRVNVDEFIPKGKEQVFTTARPDVPHFSRPMHIASELKTVGPEDFSSAVLGGEESLEGLHKPEPIVPPPKPKEFKHISPDLEKVAEAQIARSMKTHNLNEPLFVKADDYKSLMGALSVIRTKIGDSEKILSDLNELKNIKDKTFEKWRNELEDIQRKLLYVDKTLYEQR